MNQLLICTEALGDVHAYVNTTMTSCNYIEPAPNASKSIIYRQLFDELVTCVLATFISMKFEFVYSRVLFSYPTFFIMEHFRANHRHAPYTINIPHALSSSLCHGIRLGTEK